MKCYVMLQYLVLYCVYNVNACICEYVRIHYMIMYTVYICICRTYTHKLCINVHNCIYIQYTYRYMMISIREKRASVPCAHATGARRWQSPALEQQFSLGKKFTARALQEKTVVKSDVGMGQKL